MKKTFLSHFLSCAIAAGLWIGSASSSYGNVALGNALLNGLQPTTPNSSSAMGVSILSVDTLTGLYDLSLFVSGITPSQLMGAGANSTPVHLHNALSGADGPIVVDLGYAGTITALGTTGFKLDVTGGTFGGVQGSLNGPSVNDNLASLIAGSLYINIHTMAFPGGEIRGQFSTVVVPEPASYALGGLGLGGLAALMYFRKRRYQTA